MVVVLLYLFGVDGWLVCGVDMYYVIIVCVGFVSDVLWVME